MRSRILEMVSSSMIIRNEEGSEYDILAGLGRTMPLAALNVAGWCPLASRGESRKGMIRGLIR
jgi:hypothetical protein